MEINFKTYSSPKIVRLYHSLDDPLQKPENTIFNILKPIMVDTKMLDIGVGGGRTTKYFAPSVKEYIGIDYIEDLTTICKKKFPHFKFLTADIRDLSMFSKDEFDFILFSFNGIDYISHNDRLTALNQIKRILKTKGYFCFSSHNIQLINTWNRAKFSISPFSFIDNLFKYYKRKSINKLTTDKIRELVNADYAVLNDGSHYWQLQTYYVKIDFQIKILVEAGFKDIRIFDLKKGKELDENGIRNNKDGWVYYLCNKG